jgi:methylated-DNA-protein-cysteine methyltransferase related protein
MSGETTSFKHRVYSIVAMVPFGKVTTYGAIAAALGDPRKAREVGWALAATPANVDIPAHRVVNRAGELSGGWAFGSPLVQRALLEGEGVTFASDDRIALSHHLWLPPSQEPPTGGGEESQPRLL